MVNYFWICMSHLGQFNKHNEVNIAELLVWVIVLVKIKFEKKKKKKKTQREKEKDQRSLRIVELIKLTVESFRGMNNFTKSQPSQDTISHPTAAAYQRTLRYSYTFKDCFSFYYFCNASNCCVMYVYLPP